MQITFGQNWRIQMPPKAITELTVDDQQVLDHMLAM
jgi:hypothetical protein